LQCLFRLSFSWFRWLSLHFRFNFHDSHFLVSRLILVFNGEIQILGFSSKNIITFFSHEERTHMLLTSPTYFFGFFGSHL
jgi:hypothetical protein